MVSRNYMTAEVLLLWPSGMHCLLDLLGPLQELSASSSAVGSSSAQVAALQVVESVVSEFSLVTASQLGLSWEFHETCRNQLEVSQQPGTTTTTTTTTTTKKCITAVRRNVVAAVGLLQGLPAQAASLCRFYPG
jgi:hypothetical protein